MKTHFRSSQLSCTSVSIRIRGKEGGGWILGFVSCEGKMSGLWEDIKAFVMLRGWGQGRGGVREESFFF